LQERSRITYLLLGDTMNKIILTDGSGRWFDADTARRFDSATVTTNSGHEVPLATGDADVCDTLWLTFQGTFVLTRSIEQHPEADSAEEIDMKTAASWLMSYGHQGELKKFDMGLEEGALEI
jgi:hypothetical protein